MTSATASLSLTNKINNIDDLSEAVQNLGYNVIEKDSDNSTLSIVIPINDEQFIAILDINDDITELVIESQIAKLGDIPDNDTALALLMRMVSINSEIMPYATNLNEPVDTDRISELDESPITVIDSVPLGDFSVGELQHSLSKLQSAITLTTLNMRTIINND